MAGSYVYVASWFQGSRWSNRQTWCKITRALPTYEQSILRRFECVCRAYFLLMAGELRWLSGSVWRLMKSLFKALLFVQRQRKLCTDLAHELPSRRLGSSPTLCNQPENKIGPKQLNLQLKKALSSLVYIHLMMITKRGQDLNTMASPMMVLLLRSNGRRSSLHVTRTRKSIVDPRYRD